MQRRGLEDKWIMAAVDTREPWSQRRAREVERNMKRSAQECFSNGTDLENKRR